MPLFGKTASIIRESFQKKLFLTIADSFVFFDPAGAAAKEKHFLILLFATDFDGKLTVVFDDLHPGCVIGGKIRLAAMDHNIMKAGLSQVCKIVFGCNAGIHDDRAVSGKIRTKGDQ